MSGIGEVRVQEVEDETQRTEARAGGEREVRWSARRKEGIVLRLLRGESLDALAREVRQPAGRIAACVRSSWRRAARG